MSRLALAAGSLCCLTAAWLAADSIERSLLLNAARLVVAVELFTLPPAILLAFLLARTTMPGRWLVLLLCSSLLFIPLYLQLCGWEAAFGRQGWHTYAFNTLQDPWLSGWRGAIAVHVVYTLPWATLLMTAAFSQGDRQHEEAALLDADAPQVLRCVTLPQLGGGVLLAAAWIFVITAGEMTVTNIYLVPTYTEDVYNFYAGNADAKANVVHQLPLLLFTAGLVLCLLVPLPSPALSNSFASYRWRLGKMKAPLAACAIALLILLALFPVANLVERTGEDVVRSNGQLQRHWSAEKATQLLVTAPIKYRDEFAATGELAASVTASATLLALLFAWWTHRRAVATGAAWLVAIFCIAIPGPVIGLSMIALFNHDVPPLPFLYDRTLAAPICATLVRVLPLAFIPCWWAMHTLDDEPFDAAALDGASHWQKLSAIALPQRWPIVAAAALAAFVIASGDVSASLLVLPPGPLETIARRMFGLIHVGADDQVASVALVCWGGYWIVAGAVTFLLWRSSSRAQTS